MTQYSGVSAFACMHPGFPQDACLATLDFAPHPVLTCLWNTFADVNPGTCAIFHRFTSRYANKPHMIEIHPINNTAIRNKKQYAGEPFPGYDIKTFNRKLEAKDPYTMHKITDIVRQIKGIMESSRNPNTFLTMTTGLEDDYTTRAFQNITAEIQKSWPYFLIRSGAASGTFPREQHGKKAQAGGTTCFVNEDGAIQSLSDSAKWLKRNTGALAKILWRPAHQGRNVNTNDFGKPPRERTFIWTAKDVVELGNLLRVAG